MVALDHLVVFGLLNHFNLKPTMVREAAKHVPPLLVMPLRGGWGKGRAIKERTFVEGLKG